MDADNSHRSYKITCFRGGLAGKRLDKHQFAGMTLFIFRNSYPAYQYFTKKITMEYHWF